MSDTVTYGQVSPWSRAARRRVFAAMAGSALALAFAYAGMSAEDSLNEQAFWLDLAVFASIVAGCAQAMWLVHGRRSVSQLRRQVLSEMTRPSVVAEVAAPTTDYVTVAMTPWVHRSACPLAVGKTTRPVLAQSFDARCPVCRP